MRHKKAAIFILLGQSNAVGHGIPMEEKDIINTPLNNVFAMRRSTIRIFTVTACLLRMRFTLRPK